MGMFDGLFDFSNPNTMAWLGALAGLGQAAAPSRLPVTTGQVFGSLAGGLAQGAKAGQDYNKDAMQAALYGAQVQEALRKAELLKQAPDLLKGIVGPGTPASASPATSAAPTSFGSLAPGFTRTDSGNITWNGREPDTMLPGGIPAWNAPSGGDTSSIGPLAAAIEKVESGGNPKAVSPAGAIGLRQIMPSTAADYGVTDKSALFDPSTNRQLGDKILTDLLGRYNGDVDAALVAYNAGPARADKWIAAGRDPNALPAETQKYVPAVKGVLAQMAPGAAGQPGAPAFGSLAPPVPSTGAPPLAVAPGAAATNIDPLALAKARAALGLGGIAGDPLSGFKDLYYNSPQYLAAKAASEAWAKVQPDLYTKWAGPEASPDLQGRISGAQAWAKLDPEQRQKYYEALLAIGQANNAPQSARPGETININPQRVPLPLPPGMAAPGGTQAGIPAVGQAAPSALPSGGLTIEGRRPEEIARAEVRGKNEETARQAIIDKAGTSAETRASLMNMMSEAGNFTQGPFALPSQKLASYLRLVMPSYDKQVASFEDFVKNSEGLVRKAVRATDSNPAVQQFQMIRASLPQPETSPLGLRKVGNQLIGVEDYTIAQAQAIGKYGDKPGFQTWWQNNVSPQAFIFARMHPDDQAEFVGKLQQSDQGKNDLAVLRKQLQFLKENGINP